MGALRRPFIIALLSAGTVGYEILLIRTFAIQYFHHFAYMAIGVAMMGFGVAGTMLALVPPSDTRRARRWFSSAVVLTPVSLIVAVALVQRVPIDPTRLAYDGSQWLLLGLVYPLLAVPFAAGAAATVLGLMLEPERRGRVYGASFVGAGLGAGVAMAALWFLAPDRALAVPPVLAGAGTLVALTNWPSLFGRAVGGTVAVLVLATALRPPWDLPVNPYKGLPQIEAYPDAARTAETHSPMGWVAAISAPAFRHAPGLSLAYSGELPPQTALFIDGDLTGAVVRQPLSGSATAMFDWLPSALPYQIGNHTTALILGAGGDTEVLNAIAHGAQRVTAVELHPGIVRFARAALGERGRQVDWVTGDVRTYVARSDRRYDVIVLPAAGGFGTSTAGVHALDADFVHTVDAYVGYLRHLAPNGTLSVTRWLSVPPRESVRMVLTVADALRRLDPTDVASRIVVVRGWGTVTVLAKPDAFDEADIADVREWATSRRFDVDWPAASTRGEPFNVLDEPTFSLAARAVEHGPDSVARFIARYPFQVGPMSDARPYPHHFTRATSIPTLLSSARGAWLPFAEWGFITLVATLAQAAVAGAVFLFGPLLLVRATRPARRGEGGSLAYFGAIGLAYMAAEIATIQQLGLLLGHPVYAVTTVIILFLVCSGVGSAMSDNSPRPNASRLTMSLAGALLFYAVALLPVVHLLQSTAGPIRILAAVVLLSPLAYVMGQPFPAGLRAMRKASSSSIAWAWAANGFASVVAAPLAALVALELGSPALYATAAACYAAAGFAARNQVTGAADVDAVAR